MLVGCPFFSSARIVVGCLPFCSAKILVGCALFDVARILGGCNFGSPASHRGDWSHESPPVCASPASAWSPHVEAVPPAGAAPKPRSGPSACTLLAPCRSLLAFFRLSASSSSCMFMSSSCFVFQFLATAGSSFQSCTCAQRICHGKECLCLSNFLLFSSSSSSLLFPPFPLPFSFLLFFPIC